MKTYYFVRISYNYKVEAKNEKEATNKVIELYKKSPPDIKNIRCPLIENSNNLNFSAFSKHELTNYNYNRKKR